MARKLDDLNVRLFRKTCKRQIKLPFEYCEQIPTEFIAPAEAGYLQQNAIEKVLAELLNSEKEKTAKDVLYLLVREQGWATEGQEAAYIETHRPLNTAPAFVTY